MEREWPTEPPTAQPDLPPPPPLPPSPGFQTPPAGGKPYAPSSGVDRKLAPLISFMLAGGIPAFFVLSAGFGETDTGAGSAVGATLQLTAAILAFGGVAALVTWAFTQTTSGMVKGVSLAVMLVGSVLWGAWATFIGLMLVLIERNGG